MIVNSVINLPEVVSFPLKFGVTLPLPPLFLSPSPPHVPPPMPPPLPPDPIPLLVPLPYFMVIFHIKRIIQWWNVTKISGRNKQKEQN